jgi:hypothetical protein
MRTVLKGHEGMVGMQGLLHSFDVQQGSYPNRRQANDDMLYTG